ncbi:hypothetical protein DFH11DRAFT_1744953 [Phellopilus nigrolimitatus]|nr:hypothetical protein DFH11DRAFT_1744953 [Phellopilus nigrolimitatus]
MPKRARVPAALHSELTEYASLLRALRTNQTLDLSAHLSQLPPSSSQPALIVDDASDIDLTDGELDDPSFRTTSPPLPPDSDLVLPVSEDQANRVSPRAASSSRASTERATDQPPRKKRKRTLQNDTWTRWPLLAGDVHRPEWGLADEVQLIADHVRRHQRAAWRRQAPSASSSDPPPTSPSFEDHPPLSSHRKDTAASELRVDSESESDLDSEPDPAQRALTASTSAHLRSLLSLLAAHIPCVEASLRGRLAPTGWPGVLAAAGAGGLVDANTLARVGARLEALYALSPSPTLKPAVKILETHGNADARPASGSTLDPLRAPTPDPSIQLQPELPILPSPLPLPPIRTLVVHAARERLRALTAQREAEGDGDVLSFCGPHVDTKSSRKARGARSRGGKTKSRGGESGRRTDRKQQRNGQEEEEDGQGGDTKRKGKRKQVALSADVIEDSDEDES